jgi:hypothetical protein
LRTSSFSFFLFSSSLSTYRSVHLPSSWLFPSSFRTCMIIYQENFKWLIYIPDPKNQSNWSLKIILVLFFAQICDVPIISSICCGT